jgi:hypothetical protein
MENRLKQKPILPLKRLKQSFLVCALLFLNKIAFADTIMSGLQKTNSYVKSGAILISTIAVIGAGLIMAFNKERGFDRMSGAVIGLACIAGASGLVALIQSFFG